jgi:zinc/manganese transport system substrate-binding protein
MRGWGILMLGLLGLAACGGDGPATGVQGRIAVVAGESFWGSRAEQLGGARAVVESVVSDPSADPHEYESTAGDARAFADAGLVILNGAGYDDWARRLLAAGSSGARQLLDVGALLGHRAGDNPHFWYDPGAVVEVADAITARYSSIDPSDASYFAQRRAELGVAFEPYLAEIATIKRRFAGSPIGATESVFVYMAEALGLDLTTPPAFMNALAAGNDPPVQAVVTFRDQIAGRQIRVLVYNLQTATAVTTNLKAVAAAGGVTSVGVSETLQPAGATFQDWQLAQLERLETALAGTA